jgi:hypothetical protein
MSRALRLWASAMIAVLAVTPVAAADLATPVEPLPPAPPRFYVHAGGSGIFFQTNAQPTGGGLFTTTNIAIRPVYTVTLEAGYFITPNVAIALSSGRAADRASQGNWAPRGANLRLEPPRQYARRRCYVPPSISFEVRGAATG